MQGTKSTINILRHFGFFQDKILSGNTLVFFSGYDFISNVALKSI